MIKYFVVILIFASTYYAYITYPKTVEQYPQYTVGGVGADFHIYYEAARGNYHWGDQYHSIKGWEDFGFLYPSYTANFWCWTLPFSFNTAYKLNCILYAIAFSTIFWKVYGYAETEIEKILVIAAVLSVVHSFGDSVGCGNVIPILAMCILSPVGCIVASAFKFWPIVFLPLHYFLSPSFKHSRTFVWINNTSNRLFLSTSIGRSISSLSLEEIICNFKHYDRLF